MQSCIHYEEKVSELERSFKSLPSVLRGILQKRRKAGRGQRGMDGGHQGNKASVTTKQGTDLLRDRNPKHRAFMRQVLCLYTIAISLEFLWDSWV